MMYTFIVFVCSIITLHGLESAISVHSSLTPLPKVLTKKELELKDLAAKNYSASKMTEALATLAQLIPGAMVEIVKSYDMRLKYPIQPIECELEVEWGLKKTRRYCFHNDPDNPVNDEAQDYSLSCVYINLDVPIYAAYPYADTHYDDLFAALSNRLNHPVRDYSHWLSKQYQPNPIYRELDPDWEPTNEKFECFLGTTQGFGGEPKNEMTSFKISIPEISLFPLVLYWKNEQTPLVSKTIATEVHLEKHDGDLHYNKNIGKACFDILKEHNKLRHIFPDHNQDPRNWTEYFRSDDASENDTCFAICCSNCNGQIHRMAPENEYGCADVLLPHTKLPKSGPFCRGAHRVCRTFRAFSIFVITREQHVQAQRILDKNYGQYTDQYLEELRKTRAARKAMRKEREKRKEKDDCLIS